MKRHPTLEDEVVVYANATQIVNSVGVSYSVVGGGHRGTGNLDADPLFWAPFGAPSGEGHDFHLRAGSPCIDAGDPSSPLDPDGSPADIGVFPFDAGWCVGPVTYCTAKTNSLGCVPAIAAGGAPSLSAGPLVVSASQVLNNKAGLLFWGVAPQASPFQGGLKCVATPIVRTPVQTSDGNPPPDDCSGTYSFTFDAAYLSLQGLAAGQELHAQFWSRDPQSCRCRPSRAAGHSIPHELSALRSSPSPAPRDLDTHSPPEAMFVTARYHFACLNASPLLA